MFSPMLKLLPLSDDRKGERKEEEEEEGRLDWTGHRRAFFLLSLSLPLSTKKKGCRQKREEGKSLGENTLVFLRRRSSFSSFTVYSTVQSVLFDV